jgi:hypothetical protein
MGVQLAAWAVVLAVLVVGAHLVRGGSHKPSGVTPHRAF